MMGTTVVVIGVVLMVWPHRREQDASAVGDALREAYAEAATAPVPRDMRHLTRQLAGPLRVVPRGVR